MVQINWTRTAVEDLKSIFDYIAKDSKKYAQLQTLKLKSRTLILKSKPFIGKKVAEK